MNIRPARMSDHPVCVRIKQGAVKSFGAHFTGAPLTSSEFRESVEAGLCWVAEHNGFCRGYVRLLDCGTFFHLFQLYVEPASQRQGVGRQLAGKAVAHGQRRQDKVMTLITSGSAPWAVPFYEACGFSIVDDDALPEPVQSWLKADKAASGYEAFPLLLPRVGMVHRFLGGRQH